MFTIIFILVLIVIIAAINIIALFIISLKSLTAVVYFNKQVERNRHRRKEPFRLTELQLDDRLVENLRVREADVAGF